MIHDFSSHSLCSSDCANRSPFLPFCSSYFLSSHIISVTSSIHIRFDESIYMMQFILMDGWIVAADLELEAWSLSALSAWALKALSKSTFFFPGLSDYQSFSNVSSIWVPFFYHCFHQGWNRNARVNRRCRIPAISIPAISHSVIDRVYDYASPAPSTRSSWFSPSSSIAFLAPTQIHPYTDLYPHASPKVRQRLPVIT